MSPISADRARARRRAADARLLLEPLPPPFYDIAKGGNAPIATEALERIAALYAIEAEIRGSSADERRAVRQPARRRSSTSSRPG